MSTKKTRSDALEAKLTELQFLTLRDGLIDRTFASYAEALSWLETECGVSSSPAGLSAFWRRCCAPVVRERRQFAALKAEALGDAMEKDPINWDLANLEKAKQLTFEFLEAGDLEAATKLLGEITKANKHALDRDKFAEAMRKARAADEAKEVMNSDLSQEERNARLKEILK